jgi:hypothetical protein
VVALIVILFPPLLIAFLLVMERVEEPLRRPTSQREVEDFLGSATPGEVGTLAHSGIRRAMSRWRSRPSGCPRPARSAGTPTDAHRRPLREDRHSAATQSGQTGDTVHR